MWISKKKLAEIQAECFDDGKSVGKAECQQLANNCTALQREKADLLKKCANLTKKVREQAKADMIFEAIKLIRMGLMDDSPSVQPDVQSQYAAMQSAQTQYRGQYSSGASGLYTGILGGLIR